jgi:hypothetical protein
MKYLTGAALGALGLFALSSNASAAIVCNGDGDCWRTAETYDYPPEVNLNVYDDDWAIDENKYKLREARPGRGYYRGGVWIDF